MTSSSSAPDSGSWAVKELTEGGLKIVVSDAGKNLDIARDFAADGQVGRRRIVGRGESTIQATQFQSRCASSEADPAESPEVNRWA
jgi:hypothetical protein